MVILTELLIFLPLPTGNYRIKVLHHYNCSCGSGDGLQGCVQVLELSYISISTQISKSVCLPFFLSPFLPFFKTGFLCVALAVLNYQAVLELTEFKA